MKKEATQRPPRLSKEKILNWYMEDVLSGNSPENIFLFSKNHGIEESDFYKHFNSFRGVKNHFFELIFDKTFQTLYKSEEYGNYEPKEKLLSFYFTFFGNLSSNRSFVMHLLPAGRMEGLKNLSGLRKRFIDYATTLEVQTIDLKSKRLNGVQEKAMKEAAWMQLLGTIKFWMRDESSGFEKTDIFIEKSISAGFELMNISALKSVADFGKFLFKEMNPVR